MRMNIQYCCYYHHHIITITFGWWHTSSKTASQREFCILLARKSIHSWLRKYVLCFRIKLRSTQSKMVNLLLFHIQQLTLLPLTQFRSRSSFEVLEISVSHWSQSTFLNSLEEWTSLKSLTPHEILDSDFTCWFSGSHQRSYAFSFHSDADGVACIATADTTSSSLTRPVVKLRSLPTSWRKYFFKLGYMFAPIT